LFQAQPGTFRLLSENEKLPTMADELRRRRAGRSFCILGSMGYLESPPIAPAAAQLVNAGKGAEVSIVLEGSAAAGKGQ